MKEDLEEKGILPKYICRQYGTTLHRAINDKRFW